MDGKSKKTEYIFKKDCKENFIKRDEVVSQQSNLAKMCEVLSSDPSTRQQWIAAWENMAA